MTEKTDEQLDAEITSFEEHKAKATLLLEEATTLEQKKEINNIIERCESGILSAVKDKVILRDGAIIKNLQATKNITPEIKPVKKETIDDLLEQLALLDEVSEGPSKFNEPVFTESLMAEKEKKRNVIQNKIRLAYNLEPVIGADLTDDDIIRLDKAGLLEEYLQTHKKAYGLKDRAETLIRQTGIVETIQQKTDSFFTDFEALRKVKTPKKFIIDKQGRQEFTNEYKSHILNIDNFYKRTIKLVKAEKSYLKDGNEKSSKHLEKLQNVESDLSSKLHKGYWQKREGK